MWPTWVFYLMLIAAGVLFVMLAWELLKDVNAKAARWWRFRRVRRDHRQYVARHAQVAREAGR